MPACNIYYYPSAKLAPLLTIKIKWNLRTKLISIPVKGRLCHAILSHFIMLKYVVFTVVETGK